MASGSASSKYNGAVTIGRGFAVARKARSVYRNGIRRTISIAKW